MTITAAVAALLLSAVGICLHHRARERSLRASLAESRQRIGRLSSRLLDIESEARRDQARIHEIGSIVAGIAAATEVVQTVRPNQRAALETAIAAEMLRLRRVLADDAADDARPVDLDRVIERVVTTHRTRGRTISWQPSGVDVLTGSDALAETLNELLENAARHGSPDRIEVEVVTRGGQVQIAVHDSGPGVGNGLGGRIFEWGAQRPDSPGQGIGLAAARRRIRGCGGDLRLAEHGATGARFVVTVPLHRVAAELQRNLTLVG